MREINDDTLYDTRLIARHITQGLITQKDVDDRLKNAEDKADFGEVIDLDGLLPTRGGGHAGSDEN